MGDHIPPHASLSHRGERAIGKLAHATAQESDRPGVWQIPVSDATASVWYRMHPPRIVLTLEVSAKEKAALGGRIPGAA